MDGKFGRRRRSRRSRCGLALRSGGRSGGTSDVGRGTDLLAGDLPDCQVVVVGLGCDVLGLVFEVGVVVFEVGVVVEVVVGDERIRHDDRIVGGIGGRVRGFERFVVVRLRLGRARGSVGHPFVVTPGARHKSSDGGRSAGASVPKRMGHRSSSGGLLGRRSGRDRRRMVHLSSPAEERVALVIRNALATILLLLVVGACDFATVAPASPRIIEGLGVEFRAQPAPPGFDQEATLDRIRREYGVGSDRAPDAVTYGVATCIDTGCFGDAGSGPLPVWLIEWEPDQGAASVRLLVDAATGVLLRYE